jgi:hypothetical protein
MQNRLMPREKCERLGYLFPGGVTSFFPWQNGGQESPLGAYFSGPPF